MTKATRKKPAPRPRMQDATLINIRALKKRVAALERQVKWLADAGVRRG
jgi:hypothetical protein